MAELVLKNVYKVYSDGTVAVNNFNLDIADGEFLVLVGPSGCGKSTTLRMIAGLEDITAGSFYIDGKKANALEPKDRNMAMVFQNYALYPHMNVYENMAFGLRINKVPKDIIDERVKKAASILGLESQLTKKPKDMSGGQRQRVALGRAIVRQPSVFLLDEPLSNLDAKLRASMRSEIRRLHDSLNTTFIYVTHDQIEAMTMGTKIVVMNKGFIQQVDTPMNLYDYPENLFVAGFIGSPQMNFFNATCKVEGDKVKFSFGGFDLEYPLSSFPKINSFELLKNPEVKIGIRPEHFSIVEKEEKNTIKVRVGLIELLGNEMVCDGYLENNNEHIVAKVLRNNNVRQNDFINLKIEDNMIHIFSKEDEDTLNPRLPKHSFLKFDKDMFGGRIDLPEEYLNIKDASVLVPVKAITKGEKFTLKILKQEKINNKYLLTLETKNKGQLFVESEEEVKGDKYSFDIKAELFSFTNSEGDVIINPIPERNILKGKLSPNRRRVKLDKKVVTKKVFDYAIGDTLLRPNDEIVTKIYALLGKKFALHSIEYSFAPEKATIAKEGIKGNVINNIKFSDDLMFSVLDIDGEQVYIKTQEELEINKSVFIKINPDELGVRDINFDVVII